LPRFSKNLTVIAGFLDIFFGCFYLGLIRLLAVGHRRLLQTIIIGTLPVELTSFVKSFIFLVVDISVFHVLEGFSGFMKGVGFIVLVRISDKFEFKSVRSLPVGSLVKIGFPGAMPVVAVMVSLVRVAR
jgi:hypothetical protein